MSNRRLISGAAGLLLLSLAVAQEKTNVPQIHGIRIGDSLEDLRKRFATATDTGGTSTRDGGRKEAWLFPDGPLKSLAVRTDAKGKVTWISGFFRTGSERPFSAIGDIHRASTSDTEAVWTHEDREGAIRIVAKGSDQRARVLYLIRLPLRKAK